MDFLKVKIEGRIGTFNLKIDLGLDEGFGVLFGPSGAGKSMTLRFIAGLEKPRAGTIELNGRTLFCSSNGINLPPYKRKTAMVFQDLALFPNMNVAGNILYGMEKGDNSRLLREMVELFRLDGLEDRLPSQLSGGQQQRTALARTFASKPELVLMDEPFSSLDLPLKRNLRREIRLLQKELGTPCSLCYPRC